MSQKLFLSFFQSVNSRYWTTSVKTVHSVNCLSKLSSPRQSRSSKTRPSTRWHTQKVSNACQMSSFQLRLQFCHQQRAISLPVSCHPRQDPRRDFISIIQAHLTLQQLNSYKTRRPFSKTSRLKIDYLVHGMRCRICHLLGGVELRRLFFNFFKHSILGAILSLRPMDKRGGRGETIRYIRRANESNAIGWLV